MRKNPVSNLILIISAVAFLFNATVPIQKSYADNPPTPAEKAQLQSQLQDLQNQIAQLQGQLGTITSQKNTLQNKIKLLQNQQHTLQLQIQATNLQVSQLNSELNQTQNVMAADRAQVLRQQSEIGSLIQSVNQHDRTPLLYAIAAGKTFSDILDDIENFSKTSGALGTVVTETHTAEAQLQIQIDKYQQQQTDAQNLLSLQSLQQTQLSSSTQEQADLLKQTKGRESDYQIAIRGTQAQAAQIQARLYQLAGGGPTGAVTFGQAAQIAKNVSGEVGGIDAAFILAILTQESNLGQNVGTCNRAGDPPNKSWKVIMKPDRDQQPFISITSQLGMDPDTTPVSCPMHDRNGKQIGWGGAMGPAQFIPSTWIGYQDKVAAITGHPANPWDINDAFIAAAIKLKSGGADGTYQGDWNAAMRYFSGSTNLAYRFYGDQVMATTARYQTDLQTLGQ